jgi:plastocyanin
VAATAPSTATAPAAGATLAIRDFAFAATSVAPGGLVIVVNADSAAHTVTAAGRRVRLGRGAGRRHQDVPGS